MAKHKEAPKQRREVLERYYTDLYRLFLKHFTRFELDKVVHEYDIKRLEELLKEIIYVRSIIDEL